MGNDVFPGITPGAGPNPPVVYVSEKDKWEYKVWVRNLAKDNPPGEDELNALGADGWELSGVFSDSPFVYFYFKRPA